MEHTNEPEQANEDTYISLSKRNIDNYLRKGEFRKAFAILIMFLERLDDIEIRQVVDYYSTNLEAFGLFRNTFPSK